MVWDERRIIEELTRLHRRGASLSYNALAKRKQALVSAAAYHFGSYRRAIEAAGIDYATVTRRPRWTKQEIISLIKAARRRGDDLHWSAVIRRRDEVARAAFAALQPRMFGNWVRALHAAGLDSDQISRYRKWDRHSVIYELKARAADQEPLNSGQIQREDSGLHSAAVRHFGSYEAALRAAKVDPASVRRRRKWTRADVLAGLRQAHRNRQAVSDLATRRRSPALYGAAVRLFGTFKAARRAAGVDAKR